MKNVIAFLSIMMLLLPTAFIITGLAEGKENSDIIHSGRYGDGYRYNAQGWIYLHIEGRPYERGYQHGYLLAAEIVDHIERWSNVIHNGPIYGNKYIDHSSAKYEELSNKWWDFCRSRISKIYWDRTPEEYQSEMKGIADGVKNRGWQVHGRDVDYIDILAINHMFEYMTRFDTRSKSFHPLKDLFNTIKGFIPMGTTEDGFIKSFLEAPKADRCNGFIATGDATTQGQIVAAQGIRCGGWWYPYYVAQRWNVVIDIIPSDGYRFQMQSCPGYIWSDANYYQSEEGIIIMDTTLTQGLWKDSGYSMVIRTRLAIQYSSSLDEALDNLMYKNDGLWTASYLIGDTESGEIARLDLGLYAYDIWRTFDGFYEIDNNAKSIGVRAEGNGLGIKGELIRIANLLSGSKLYTYFTLRHFDAPRGAKMKELGEEYYGDIDIDVLRNKIMFEHPVCDGGSTDLKATDSYLLDQNCLWVFWGRVNGNIWNTSAQASNLKGVRDVPPAGWTLICGVPPDHNYELPEIEEQYPEPVKESKLLWKYDFADDYEGRNQWYANIVYNDDMVFGAGLDGDIYALNAITGKEKWSKEINNIGGLSLTWINADEDNIYVGWENETCAIDQKTNNIIWTNDDVKFISSQPVFINDLVIFGNRNGEIFALDKVDGKIIWESKVSYQKVYLSVDVNRNLVLAGAQDKLYALDADEGKAVWNVSFDGMIVTPSKVVGSTVFVGSCDSNIYAIDADSGNIKWKTETGWGITTTPAYSCGSVFVGSLDHHLYAFDEADGDMLWSFACNGAIHSTPEVYGDYVFFGSDDGWFYAVNKTNGELAWKFDPAFTIDDDIYNYITTALVGNNVAEDGRVFFSGNGYIYAFNAQTIEPDVVEEEEKFKLSYGEKIILIIVILVLITIISLAVYAKKK